MHVFRLVQSGLVDKIIAFEDLPKRMLDGVEMHLASGLPRHWRDFIGKQTKVTPPQPDKNAITGEVKMVCGGTEVGPFCYVLYYKEINKDMQRWQEISSFVRRVVSLQFRLMDKLEDMALPLATDAASEIKLEPEALEEQGALIPIPVEFQEKTPAVLDKDGKEIRPELPSVVTENAFKCERCEKTFTKEQAVKMHMYRAHQEPKEAKQAVTAYES